MLLKMRSTRTHPNGDHQNWQQHDMAPKNEQSQLKGVSIHVLSFCTSQFTLLGLSQNQHFSPVTNMMRVVSTRKSAHIHSTTDSKPAALQGDPA